MQRQSDILAAVVIGSAMDFSLRFLLVAAVAAQSYVAPALADNYFCLQQFALCTSAPCIPDPGNPKRAICTCNVEDGPNLATVACDTVKPSVDASGIRTVYSQFALKQFAQGKRTLKCPAGTPWTWCLNKPCTVDPANPSKAICACDVLRSGEWITAGGNCNATTCNTAYWSGAPLGDFKDGTDFLVKQLKLKKSPVNWCSPADARSSGLQADVGLAGVDQRDHRLGPARRLHARGNLRLLGEHLRPSSRACVDDAPASRFCRCAASVHLMPAPVAGIQVHTLGQR